MTKHVHECKYQLRQTLTYRRFVCSGCPNIISIADAEEILNEYKTLKAATERLSAVQASYIYVTLSMFDNVQSHVLDDIRAYVDILEGKDG